MVDVDDAGRVLLEFPWDDAFGRERRLVRRTRVSQGWAGAGYGFVTWPRVGDEVVVAFSDGDPEQPIVVGRVHNGRNLAPATLPEPDKHQSIWQSRSVGSDGPTEGYNAIIMENGAGEERLLLRAERDLSASVVRDAAEKTGRDRTLDVGRDHVMRVAGHQQLHVSKGVDQQAQWMRSRAKSDWRIDAPLAAMTADAFRVKANVVEITASQSIRLAVGGSSILVTAGGSSSSRRGR